MTEAPPRNIVIAIWGVCKGNPGPGAYTATLHNIDTGREKRLQGRAAATTANRMELTAAIEGLNSLRSGAVVTVIANSEYVAKGMNEWLPGWKAKGWRTAANKPVVSADLWMELEAAAGKHERVRWVVGERTGSAKSIDDTQEMGITSRPLSVRACLHLVVRGILETF